MVKLDNVSEFDNAYELVYRLLEIDPLCRSDDRWLCYRALRVYGGRRLSFEDFVACPSFETLTRCRRKIQNTEGLFLPSDVTLSNRCERETTIKEWLKNS